MKRSRPQDACRFEPADFAAVFEIAISSGETLRHEDSADLDVELTGDDGLPVRLSNTPFNRAGIALKRHFGNDDTRFVSALFRFHALMELVTNNALGRWMRSSIRHEGSTRLHPAVLDVASHMRLSKNGRFPVNKFLEAVEETAKAHYPDLPEWPLDAPDRDPVGHSDPD